MEGMMAQRSVIVWVLSGTLPPSARTGSSCMLSHQMFCATDSIMTSFWDLESVGVASDEASRRDDDSVMTQFEESVTYDGSRYQVKLPWKLDTQKLLDNEAQARQRLRRLTGKLSKDKVLCELYHDVFCDYLQEGFIEEVPQQQSGVQGPGPHIVYYMPHRPVVKESSTTTNVRPVWCVGQRALSILSQWLFGDWTKSHSQFAWDSYKIPTVGRGSGCWCYQGFLADRSSSWWPRRSSIPVGSSWWSAFDAVCAIAIWK